MRTLLRWLDANVWGVVFALCTGSAAYGEVRYPETPEEVVQAFCAAYSQGAGLSTDTSESVYKYTTWRDAPGWDRAQIIQRYELARERPSSSPIQVRVRFQIVGNLESGEKHQVLQLVRSEEEVTFTTLEIDGRWKITKPLISPHISVATAIRLLESEMPSLPKDEQVKRRRQIQSLREVTE